MASIQRVLIVGLGNLLLGDEGLGVHVANTLRAADPPLPSGVEVIDAGTSLLDVVPELAKCDRAILVDAIRGGGEPGAIYRVDLAGGAEESAAPRHASALSLHEVAVDDTLAAARLLGMLPRRLELIGAEPDSLEPGLALSPPVRAAAMTIVRMLESEIRASSQASG
jgi:hydrogenase maturation protease